MSTELSSAALPPIPAILMSSSPSGEVPPLLSAILSHTEDGIAYIDRALRYVWLNEQFAALNGLSVSDHLERTVPEVLGPESWSDREGMLMRALGGERLEKLLIRSARFPSGITRHISVSYYPVHADGAVAGVIAIIKDIAGQDGSDQLLRQQSLAFENMYDTLIITDLEGLILDVNSAFERESGYSRSEALGKSITMLHLPEHRETQLAELQEGMLRDGRWSGELPYIRKDGERRIAAVTIVPIIDENGNVAGVVSANRDITEQTHQRTLLARQQERLEQQRQWLENLLDLLPTPMIMIEPGTGSVTFANRAADNLAGGNFPRGEIDNSAHTIYDTEGSRFTQIDSDDRPRMRLARGEEIHGYELDWRMPHGTRSLIVEGMILPAAHGQPAVGVMTMQDVTPLKRAERKNAALLKEAKENARKQRTFLRDVMASVTEGRMRLCDEPADLPVPLAPFGDMVTLDANNMLRTSRHLADDAAAGLDLSDERRQNLVTAVSEAAMNAIGHAGGGTVRVCTDGSETVQVWIEDQGQGIRMEHLPRATLERGFTTAGSLGHGFWLMLRTIDRLYLLTGSTGTTVVLEQYRVTPLPDWLADTA